MATATATPTSTSANITADIPLTTIFSVPSGCLGVMGVLSQGTDSGLPSAFRDYSLAVPSCYPPSFSSLEFDTDLWYSPGVCPSSYVRAFQSTDATTTALTYAWCCPSGMAYSQDSSNGWDYCSQYVTSSTVVNSGSSTNIPTSNFIGLQWPISVMWSSGDLDEFTPASAPILAAAQTTSAATVTGSVHTKTGTRLPLDSTSTETSGSATGTRSRHHSATASSSNNGGGLSTGAQAGIGVGIGVPVLALIVLGVWFFLYRRKNKANKAPDSPIDNDKDRSQPFVGTKAELPGEEARSPPAFGTAAEKNGHMQDAGIAELEPQRDGLNELEEQNYKQQMEPVELEGNAVGENAAVEAPGVQSPHGGGGRGESEAQQAARKSSRDRLVGDGS